MRQVRGVYYAAFFLQGFFGLVCQVIWQRDLLLLLGGSLYSTAAILTSYMAGLALGNWLGGLAATRFKNERLYAVIQIVLAAVILAFPVLAGLLQSLPALLFQAASSGPGASVALYLAASILILIVPCALFGAGYPVLVGVFGGLESPERVYIGRLNFFNNAGAAAGALCAGFLLLGSLGSRLTLWTAALPYLALGVSLFFIRPQGATKSPAASHGATGQGEQLDLPEGFKRGPFRAVLAALFLVSGFTFMSYELLYNRLLNYFVGNTTYSFTIIASMFILGYGGGSLIFSALFKKKKSLHFLLLSLAAIEAVIGLYHVFLPVLMPAASDFCVWLKKSLLAAGAAMRTAEFSINFISCVLLLAVPSVAFGLVFPLVNRLYFGVSAAAGKVSPKKFGILTALNTVGAVLGPLVTGFLLVGLMQVSPALRLVSVLNVCVAAAVFVFPLLFKMRKAGSLAAVGAGFLALIILSAAFVPPTNLLGTYLAKSSAADALLYFREGSFGTVSVSGDADGKLLMKINGVGEVPTDHDSIRAFRMLAYMPFLALDDPKSVLSVAFGGGITFGSIANTGIADARCVEICSDVFEAAPLYGKLNHGVVTNGSVRLIVQDGRHYVDGCPDRFDIITSDSTHPTSFDSWILYTREFYESCRRHLTPDGIFSQWIPLHNLTASDYRSILKTFSSVFPYSRLILANSYTIVMGSEKEFVFKEENFEALLRKNPAIRADFAEAGIHALEDVSSYTLLEGRQVDDYASAPGVELSLDDKTPLQFGYGRQLERTNTIADNLSELRQFRASNGLKEPALDNYIKAKLMFENRETLPDGSGPAALAFINGLDPLTAGGETLELKREIMKRIFVRTLPQLMGLEDTKSQLDTLLGYVETYPENALFRNALGYVYYRMGDRASAESNIALSLELGRWNKAVQNNCFNHYYRTGNVAMAVRALENLVVLEPGNAHYSETLRKLRSDGE